MILLELMCLVQNVLARQVIVIARRFRSLLLCLLSYNGVMSLVRCLHPPPFFFFYRGGGGIVLREIHGTRAGKIA